MPLRHVVFLEIVNDPEKISLIRGSLANLSNNVEGCSNFRFGKCVVDSNYHYFSMDFASEKDRDGYLTDPEHGRIATQVIIPSLKEGIKSAIVFDHDISGRTPSILQASGSTSGYVLMKEAELTLALENLAEYCDKIEAARPLQNRSTEPLATHPYAMQLRMKQEQKPPKLSAGHPFWQQTGKSPAKEDNTTIESVITEGPTSRL